VVWVMVPAGDPTKETVKALKELLSEGDLMHVEHGGCGLGPVVRGAGHDNQPRRDHRHFPRR